MSRLTPRAIALLLASFTAILHAEPSKIPHGTVELVSDVQSIEPGTAFQIGLLFRLEPGWHIYWKNPGDSGQPPRVAWTLPDSLKPGPIEWPVPKRLPVGPLVDYGYDGVVLLPVTVQASAVLPVTSSQALKANLRVLVCRETCMPGKASLGLTLPVRRTAPAAAAPYRQLFAAARGARPTPLPAGWRVSAQQSKDAFLLSLAAVPGAVPAGLSQSGEISFIPAAPNLVENAAPQRASLSTSGERQLKLKRPAIDSAPDVTTLEGLLLTGDAAKPVAYTVSAQVAPGLSNSIGGVAPLQPPSQGLFTILALAFGGGLILNLMPCVFPVLSIKVLSVLEHSQGERKTIQLSAALYTAGVVISFWILVAVLLSLRAAGRGLGWGFQLQSPGFVAFLICLLFVLGLSLMGVFEIGASLMNVGSGLTQQRGRYSNSFFTGVLATVVATPCTAPLMGAAVGFALGQSAVVCVLVFTVMAIGLASPFLLLSLFPGLSRLLPRPGAWMETLKQVMAFPVFASVIWLLWVLGQQVGMNQLALLLLTLLLLSIAAWIAGRWPQNRIARTVAMLAGIGIGIYVSATLLPVEASAAGVEPNQAAGSLKWEPFSPDKLAAYRAARKPVLVDFTAAWCLTCQVNDRVVFHSPDVEQRLTSSGIALLRADWTSQDPEITALLAKFGRSGIPFYVLYGADQSAAPVTLPDGLLTPSEFLAALHEIGL